MVLSKLRSLTNFRQERSTSPPPGPAIELATRWAAAITLAPGGCQAVSGESHYQPQLERAAAGRGPAGPKIRLTTAELVPDPHNSYDPNAIAVQIDGGQVGFIPKTDTGKFHPLLTELYQGGERAVCRAKLIGGFDATASLGVELDIASKVRRFRPSDPFAPKGDPVRVNVTVPDALAAAFGSRKTPKPVTATLRLHDSGVGIYLDDVAVGWLDQSFTIELTPILATLTRRELPPTFPGRIQRTDSGLEFVVFAGGVASLAAATPAEEAAEAQLAAARAKRQTGRWICGRCGDTWTSRRRAPERWWRQPEGPHVCPSCGFYSRTFPA